MSVNKENLKILQKYLALNVDQKNFGMGTWREDIHSIDFNIERTVNECGTVGCMIGHATGIKGLEINQAEVQLAFLTNPRTAYGYYSKRVFGVSTMSMTWDYLFAAEWMNIDNTVEGAIKRIQNVLDDKIPDDLPWYNEG